VANFDVCLWWREPLDRLGDTASVFDHFKQVASFDVGDGVEQEVIQTSTSMHESLPSAD
jgi:hypothetical protein